MFDSRGQRTPLNNPPKVFAFTKTKDKTTAAYRPSLIGNSLFINSEHPVHVLFVHELDCGYLPLNSVLQFMLLSE